MSTCLDENDGSAENECDILFAALKERKLGCLREKIVIKQFSGHPVQFPSVNSPSDLE